MIGNGESVELSHHAVPLTEESPMKVYALGFRLEGRGQGYDPISDPPTGVDVLFGTGTMATPISVEKFESAQDTFVSFLVNGFGPRDRVCITPTFLAWLVADLIISQKDAFLPEKQRQVFLDMFQVILFAGQREDFRLLPHQVVFWETDDPVSEWQGAECHARAQAGLDKTVEERMRRLYNTLKGALKITRAEMSPAELFHQLRELQQRKKPPFDGLGEPESGD